MTLWPRSSPSRIPHVLETHSYTAEELLGSLSRVQQKNAPEQLFVVGDTSLLRRGVRVSVVGTRQPSPEGRAAAERLVDFLVKHRVTVVSGLALGIDAVAHRRTIEKGGRTVAVLGTPLDAVSPRENLSLFQTIARDHLAVTQFAPGTRVQKGNFPRRNRTMALISHASIIVEAGEGSGTMHQGYEALRLARPLFILARVLESNSLTWPDELLRYGARVLNKPNDLFEVLPLGFTGSLEELAL